MLKRRLFQLPIYLFISLVTFLVESSTAQNAIDFTLKDLGGKEVKLSDYFGDRIILINFWATWCLPCIKELPHFQRIFNTYKDEEFIMFAISVDGPGTLAQVRNFVNRNDYNFPVLLDTESKVVALYNPSVLLPYTILIDKDGQIFHVQQGYSPGDEVVLEEKILELFEPRERRYRKDISIHAHEAFVYRHFSDKDYVEKIRDGRSSKILNQFDLSLIKGDFILGTRFDWDLDFAPADGKFHLAKRFFRMEKEKIYLNLGDFYHSIGRGLTLSLLKTFEEEGLEYLTETTVDGVRIAYNTKSLSVDLLGGWIEQERSGIKDKVLAATLGWKHRDFSTLQLSFVKTRLEEDSLWGNKSVAMESISLDIPNIADRAKLFSEFTLVQKNKFNNEQKIHGHAVYLDAGLFLGQFSFLAEFKDYKHLDFEYNRPPLLESEELEILADQFNTDVIDSTGLSVRTDYSFSPSPTLIYGKFFYSIDDPKDHPIYGPYQKEIVHFFVGLETKFKSTGYLNALVGYRQENSSDLFFLTFGKTFHYQFNISYPLTSNLSLEFDWKSKDFNGEYADYFERRSFLSAHYASRAILTIFFEQTDNPEVLFITDKKDWWAVQVEGRFSKAHSIRVFYGSTKGGVKCSGSLCRLFPPFKGFRLEVLWRF